MVNIASNHPTLILENNLVFPLDNHFKITQTNSINYSQSTDIKLVQKVSTASRNNNVVEVQNASVYTPIPPTITLVFFLAMGALGGFLKLKIVHTRLKQNKVKVQYNGD